jgi:hypothetical protein
MLVGMLSASPFPAFTVPWDIRLAQAHPLEAQLSGAIAQDGVET